MNNRRNNPISNDIDNIEFMFGSVGVDIKKVSVPIMFFILSIFAGYSYFDELPHTVKRLIKPDYYNQHDKFVLAHNKTKRIIEEWSTISDIGDISANNVASVRGNLPDAIMNYSNLTVDRLSLATQITYYYRLSRLKVIQADVSSDMKNIDEALRALDIAKSMASNTSELTMADFEFLNAVNIAYRIQRTRINALALGYFVSQEPKYMNEAKELLNELRGCEGLQRDNVTHTKILLALGCV